MEVLCQLYVHKNLFSLEIHGARRESRKARILAREPRESVELLYSVGVAWGEIRPDSKTSVALPQILINRADFRSLPHFPLCQIGPKRPE